MEPRFAPHNPVWSFPFTPQELGAYPHGGPLEGLSKAQSTGLKPLPSACGSKGVSDRLKASWHTAYGGWRRCNSAPVYAHAHTLVPP